jgi:hypothetical protein
MGDVVTHNGGTYQAKKDTAKEPGHTDWACLAAAGENGVDGTNGVNGRSFHIRGTHKPELTYEALDIVTLNSTWFIARKDNPGACPGPDWQSGPVGRRGEKGERGQRGDRGERGLPGTNGREIVEWKVDRRDFTITPILNDGELGTSFDLRDLFEEFVRGLEG